MFKKINISANKYIYLILILLLASVLRLYALDSSPAGLNADEAALGYNAWSLLETGRDEHNASWPLVFRSFDDYKPPLYVYLALPFIKVLGLNIFAVRLPSAILGILAVYGIYLLTSLLFPLATNYQLLATNSKAGKSFNLNLGLLASFLLAISPWHLHFSRGAWEVNAATTFTLFGVIFFLKALKKPIHFVTCALFFVLSLYTYHSMRLILPLLGLSLLVIYFSDLKSKFLNLKSFRTAIFSSIIIGFILLLPLAIQMLSPSGQARLSGVSVFSDTGPLWEAIELRTNHSVKVIPKVLHNKYVSYSIRFTQNYLSHFSPRFQFVIGDEIARSRVPGMGQWYLFLFPFFALGIYKLFSISSPGSRFTAAWLFISPLAAAITFQSPHALRAQNMVIPMVIIIALGFQAIYSFISNRFILILISSFLILISSFEVSRYLHQYYVHYPQELPYAWQYGFDQIADYVQSHQDEYDQVVITDRYDQPYILMAFYMKYQPTRMQQELKMEPRDKFGFSTARQVGKLFYRSIDFNKEIQQKNSLIIVANEPVPDNVVPIHTICFPDGSPGYRFYSSK